MRVLSEAGATLCGRGGDWRRRRDAIAAVIAESAPDVCVCRRCGCPGRQPRRLAERLDLRWCWVRRVPKGIVNSWAARCRTPPANPVEAPTPSIDRIISRVARATGR
jgi:hypothetical protein